MKVLTMQKFAVAAALSAGVVIAGSAAIEAQDAPAAEPKAVVDSYELMELLFEHPYAEMKEIAASNPEAGNREAWKGMYDKANTLAEVSNLLFFRNAEDYEKTPEWKTMTAATRDAAVEVAAAVRSKDIAAVNGKIEALRVSCNACHTHTLGEDGPVIE